MALAGSPSMSPHKNQPFPSPLVFPQSPRGLLGRCNYQLLNQSHQQQPNLKVNYPIIGLGLGCGGTQAGGEGPCPAPPRAKPTHPAGFAVPAQLCSPRGALAAPGVTTARTSPCVTSGSAETLRKWILAGSH